MFTDPRSVCVRVCMYIGLTSCCALAVTRKAYIASTKHRRKSLASIELPEHKKKDR